jgi:hypothetical protein
VWEAPFSFLKTMSKPLQIKSQTFVKQHAVGHLAANARRYTWRTWTAEPNHNILGGVSYLLPTEGTVVVSDSEFTLVKTGRSTFDVILTSLLSAAVNVGDKVALKYYQLRRFDGTKADGSDDPLINGCRTFSLTGASSLFPVMWDRRYLGNDGRFAQNYQPIRNPYLRDLIVQMEKLHAEDGSDRKIVNILIDAGASQLKFVDPTEAQSCEIPPAIEMHFERALFAGGKPGDLRIEYNRAMDTYSVSMSVEGAVEAVVDVHFNELSSTLRDALDDGSWAKVQVTHLKRAAVKRKQAEVLA